MGVRVLNLRDTVLRIYDEASPTLQYVTGTFIDGTLGPLPSGAPRPADVYVSSQGKADTNHHWVIESDDDIFAKIEVPMTFLLEASIVSQKFLSSLSNPYQEATWKPDDAATFTPVTTMGTRKNADGTAVTCKAPADSIKVAGLVNIEAFSTNPDSSGDDYGVKLQGCYATPPTASWSNPTGTLETTIECYGAITDLSAGFSAGTEL